MEAAAVLTVRVTPGASHDRITGFNEAGVLQVRISRPPADGKANAQLVKVLAGALGVPKRAVAIVRGGTSRIKQLEIAGLTADGIRQRLQG